MTWSKTENLAPSSGWKKKGSSAIASTAAYLSLTSILSQKYTHNQTAKRLQVQARPDLHQVPEYRGGIASHQKKKIVKYIKNLNKQKVLCRIAGADETPADGAGSTD